MVAAVQEVVVAVRALHRLEGVEVVHRGVHLVLRPFDLGGFEASYALLLRVEVAWAMVIGLPWCW